MWKHFSPCSPCSTSHNPHSERLQHLAGQKPHKHNECITLQTLLNIRELTLEVESNFASLSSPATQILISYVPTYFWLSIISGLRQRVCCWSILVLFPIQFLVFCQDLSIFSNVVVLLMVFSVWVQFYLGAFPSLQISGWHFSAKRSSSSHAKTLQPLQEFTIPEIYIHPYP